MTVGIIGTWYSAEILSHNEEQKGIFYYHTCVIIHITDETDIVTRSTTTADYSAEQRDYYLNHAKRLLPTSPGYRQLHQKPIPQYRYLKLVWDEMGKDLSYKLKYNETNQGLWISYQDQEGTISDLTYTQFSGTVQVVKAVQNHLVLTFCNRKVNGSFFSVIMTRRPNGLSEADITSNRNLLRRRGLSTSSIRKVCNSGSENIPISMIMLILSYALKHFI
ncbi:hypothetical protein ACFFRR_010018 [Megaselia abdita]